MYMYMCRYTYKCVLDFFMVHTLMNVFGCCVGDTGIWLQNVVPQPLTLYDKAVRGRDASYDSQLFRSVHMLGVRTPLVRYHI